MASGKQIAQIRRLVHDIMLELDFMLLPLLKGQMFWHDSAKHLMLCQHKYS